jgi:uncharacterized protein YbcC (UPF0753/DUF2309 family)
MSRNEIIKSIFEVLVILGTIFWQNSGLKNKLQQEILKNRKTIKESSSEESLKRYLDTQFVTLQRHYNNRLQEQFDLIAETLKKHELKDEEREP